jgi:hypothetical protein
MLILSIDSKTKITLVWNIFEISSCILFTVDAIYRIRWVYLGLDLIPLTRFGFDFLKLLTFWKITKHISSKCKVISVGS